MRPSNVLPIALASLAIACGPSQVATAQAPKDVKNDKPARKDTEAGQILNKLAGMRAGNDEWIRTMRDLIQLGPNATPDLISELDATDSDYMLRCVGFAARGINDKRIIPALIRTFPKTCLPPSNLILYRSDDSELLAFIQKHDCFHDDKREKDTTYHFGTPLIEFTATLKAMTGQTNGAEEIHDISLKGSPAQMYLQRRLYQRCAERWEKWWAANWEKHVTDKAYAAVNLKPLTEEKHEIKPFPRNGTMGSRHIGGLMMSVRDPKSKGFVFLDLDTGRWGALPEQLKAAGGEPERLDDILAWAAGEGFDLMGTEYAPSPKHEPVYVLRGLGMTLWHNPPERWKTLKNELLGDKPIELGTRSDGLLCRFDEDKKRYDAEATATFLYTTREGGHGAIFVGVPVYEIAPPQPGRRAEPEDLELKTIGASKGRRFAHCTILDVK